jgi:hypothetical protein
MARGKRGSLRREARGVGVGIGIGAAFATFVLLAAAFACGPSAAGAAKKKPAATKKAAAPAPFCSNPVDNYRAPLETLQPIPALPEGGVLPFAPPGMTLGITGPQGVLVGGSNVGFRLTNAAATTEPTRLLNWTVLERLIRLTDNGRRLHPAGLKRIDLKQLPAGKHRGLTFPITATPALYSVEVTIQNHRGRLLGRYGEYIRVVPWTVSVGLTLTAYDNVAPGSTLEGCLENHGSASVFPGATNLERYDGGAWRPVSVGPIYTVPTPAAPRILGPGETERIGFYVPPNARPGLYRAITSGGVLAPGALTPSPPAETVGLSAEFGVL